MRESISFFRKGYLLVACLSTLSLNAYKATLVVKPMHCAECIEDIKKILLQVPEVEAITALYRWQEYVDVELHDNALIDDVREKLAHDLASRGYYLGEVIEIKS